MSIPPKPDIDVFSLKVMRLLPPAAIPDAQFGLSPALNLSSSFGNVYLGDSFRAYVCVTNNTATTVKGVTLKVEMQTNSRTVLLDSPQSVFSPTQTRDFLIEHLVSEAGLHCLVCVVSFPESRTFSKFFKFTVTSPINLRTTVSALEENMYVEASVTNLTTNYFTPIVSFDPFSSFTTLEEVPEKVLIPPNATHSYLFPVYPASALPSDQGSVSLGTLSVRVSNREVCAPVLLTRPKTMIGVGFPLTNSPFDIVLLTAPDIAVLEIPFTVTVEIRNLLNQRVELKLQLKKEKMGALIPYDTSKYVGFLDGLCSKVVSLEMVAMAPGSCRIAGLRLERLDKPEKILEFDNMHEMLIVKNSSPA